MEERWDKCVEWVWAVEAAESESAEARCELGQSPSLVATQAEENQVLEDLCKGGLTDMSLGGGIVGIGIVALSTGCIVQGFDLFTVFVVVEVTVLFSGMSTLGVVLSWGILRLGTIGG